ncbi:MAG: GIY-YIG nuclease family protein [Chloroflexia bacterium]|jgi:DNA polymerase III epsilon subunit family exonuclease|nr:GIY-YIG nuclease family protein [Chloroflexia bacterium]
MHHLDSIASEQAPDGNRYEALCDRAISFLEQHNSSAHEDALVAFVFGKSASPALWRPLLHSALESEERLEYLADGTWRLTSALSLNVEITETLLPAFVAIDIETTGLKPSTQRMIEIALIRYRQGEETDRYNRMLNPGRRIPVYITKLTGIRDEDVEDAAQFSELATEIVEFIGDDVLVGHNVGFDIGFLNAELQRARHAKVINESIDTLSLATRVLPGLKRPGLDRVARALGLSPRKIHRAGVDAEITAQVAFRLEAEARRQGVDSFDALKVMASVRERRPREHVGRGRSLVDRSLLEGIPRKPGVYLMRDRNGRVIYVGKSKNLRERVGSYFSQPLGYARKMDGLLESIGAIDTEVVGSELEALLLESQLIRRHAPRYNTMMRSFEHYPYIRVDLGNRWPKITLVKDRKDDGARYFGPYRSRSSARKTVDVINDVLPLRTCTRSFKNARSYGNPCLRLAIGKCLGPCVDVSIAGEYRDMVRQVVRFLDGEDDALYAVLWAGLERAADAQDFERAEKLRRNLTVVNGIVAGQRQLRDAVERHHLMMALPGRDAGTRELWMVLEGRTWSRMVIEAADSGDVVAGADTTLTVGAPSEGEDRVIDVSVIHPGTPANVTESPSHQLKLAYQRFRENGLPPVGYDSLDDAHILNRWIAGNDGHPAIIPLDREAVLDDEYWSGIVERAIRLSDSDLEMRPDRRPAEVEAV